MPIYEYRCDEGHEVEVMQSITDPPLEECPECGAPTRRVLHSPAIHFKGSGFHNTDYGTRSRAKSGDGSDGGGSDSGGSGSDSPKSGEGSGSSDGGTGSKGGDSKSASSGDS
ncbi:MAG: FmdB family zinc ribbon protein [Solirubrobacterales bacterium]|jgi:putative FmdB family regulatory protein